MACGAAKFTIYTQTNSKSVRSIITITGLDPDAWGTDRTRCENYSKSGNGDRSRDFQFSVHVVSDLIYPGHFCLIIKLSRLQRQNNVCSWLALNGYSMDGKSYISKKNIFRNDKIFLTTLLPLYTTYRIARGQFMRARHWGMPSSIWWTAKIWRGCF